MKKCKKLFCIFLSLVFLFIPFASYNAFGIETNDFKSKIDSVLLEKLKDMKGDDSVDVSVWLTNIDKQEEEKKILEALNEKILTKELPAETIGLFDFESEYRKNNSVEKDIKAIDEAVDTKAMQLAVSTKRKASAEVYEKTNGEKLKALFNEEQINNDIIFKSRYTPSLVITLSKSEILRIAESNLVDRLYYFDADTELIEQPDDDFELLQTEASDSISREETRSGIYNFTTFQYEIPGIDYMRDTLGFTGEGINVGIIDYNYSNPANIDYIADGTIQTCNFDETGYSTAFNAHGSKVACLISGNYSNSQTGDSFLGAVPDANLYLTKGNYFMSDLEWLIGNNVNVINMSLTYGVTPNTYDYYSQFIDHIVSEHNVSFVSSVGNSGENVVAGSSFTYNSITVGNCRQTGERYGTQDNDINPSSYCNLNNTMFKPDLMAPATDVRYPAGRSSATSLPQNSYGTSLAAPIVTGAVAQLCQASSTLAANPRLMKSVLLSGSAINSYMNVTDPDHPFSMIVTDVNSTENKFSKQYGAGIVNVKNAYESYTADYIAHGYVPYFSEYVSTSKNVTASSGDLIRISAVWDKMNTSNHAYIPTITSPDFENYMLYITTPDNTVYKALYYYDTKLITSFIASQGGTYNIQLVRMSNTYNNFTSFGLSLSVQDNPLS